MMYMPYVTIISGLSLVGHLAYHWAGTCCSVEVAVVAFDEDEHVSVDAAKTTLSRIK